MCIDGGLPYTGSKVKDRDVSLLLGCGKSDNFEDFLCKKRDWRGTG